MRAISVSRDIVAAPRQIFAVLRDPARHAELDGSGMLRGRPQGPSPLGPGDRFSMGMAQGRIAYRSVNVVVEYEKDRLIAWETWGEFRGRRLVGGQRWRYELTPVNGTEGTDGLDGTDGTEGGGTTRVTHTYDWSRARLPRLIVELPGYPRRMGPAMTTTLERLASAVRD
ncbi:SRPBCC family protein [Streptomyces nigrescens]|uniref:Polyketide cyclase n=2 Tax=Streptomyces nigrescens TaxID=1920 RepID=A0A640TI54_STRNI|nr:MULTISPECIES: SRPBCC family protein [Streptomyces]WAT97184.1 SRPBCC family protein [Streptomyces libani subsp. libani]WAU05123.1 SRPBCC family protein [Streptomyces nigrescens]GFE22642.1 polyketide cyclase [Streptomyces libani subsp. libani]GGV91448.1 polyketide cyclase [Streptomyces libani subsp. libani]